MCEKCRVIPDKTHLDELKATEGFVNTEIIPVDDKHCLKPKEVLPQQRSGHLAMYQDEAD